MGVEEDVDEERRWGMGGGQAKQKPNKCPANHLYNLGSFAKPCCCWWPGVSDLLKISET